MSSPSRKRTGFSVRRWSIRKVLGSFKARTIHLKMRQTHVYMCWGSTQWRMIKAGHLFTYEHQRVPVKRCLLCNSPAAPPSPLLQLHCQGRWCCWKSFIWVLYHSHISLCATKLFNHLFRNCRLPFLAVHQCFIYQPQKCVFFVCG